MARVRLCQTTTYTRVCGLRACATARCEWRRHFFSLFSFLINSIMPIRSFYQLIPVDGEPEIGERVIMMALNRWWEWIWHNAQCWLFPKNEHIFFAQPNTRPLISCHCHFIVSLLASICVCGQIGTHLYRFIAIYYLVVRHWKSTHTQKNAQKCLTRACGTLINDFERKIRQSEEDWNSFGTSATPPVHHQCVRTSMQWLCPMAYAYSTPVRSEPPSFLSSRSWQQHVNVWGPFRMRA